MDEDVAERAELARLVVAGDVEEQALGLLDELAAARRRGRGPSSGSAARRSSRRRSIEFWLDDLRVVAGVAGDGGGRGEAGDALASRRSPRACPGCAAARRRSARRSARRDRRACGSPGRCPVARPVEVLGLEPDLVDTGVDRRLGDHHRAEDRLLGLEVLRRQSGSLGCSRSITRMTPGSAGLSDATRSRSGSMSSSHLLKAVRRTDSARAGSAYKGITCRRERHP